MKRTIMAAVAVLVAASAGQAQEGGLTEDEVRGFFDDMREQMQRAASDGEWQGIQSWMGAHLAEGASFALQGAVNTRGLVGSYAVSLDGDALRQAGGAHVMGFQGIMQALDDYALAVEVERVTALPNGEASAQVSFLEAGTLSAPQAGGEATAPEGATRGRLTFVSVSDCDLRLSGTGGEPRIELASCTTSTTF